MEEDLKLPLINTVLGTLVPEEPLFENIDFFLSHEHIFQDLSKFHLGTSQSQITLESLSVVKSSPLLISSNLVLNDIQEMSHEISLLSKAKKIAIVDATSFEYGKNVANLRAISENLNIPIITGYDIYIDKKTLFLETKKNEIFLNKESFIKKLSLEFSLGSKEGAKWGFIGPVHFSFLDDELEFLKFQSYLQFMKLSKEKIPLFIDTSFENFRKQPDFYEKLLTLLSNSEIQQLSSQIAIINIPLRWVVCQKDCEGFELKINLLEEKKIMEIFKIGFLMVFDINYYEEEQFFVEFLKKMISLGYSKRIAISLGNNYKSNLKKYGGNGFSKIVDFKNLFENIDGIQDIFRDNIFKLLKWKIMEVIKPVTVKKWICPQCKIEFDNNIEKFKKFDQECCSSKCLRQFFTK